MNSKFYKMSCPSCGGGIEFPAHGIGELIDCPHCQKPVCLEVVRPQSARKIWPICLVILATIFISSLATLVIVHRKPPPPPPPPKDFMQLKRDLIELNQALQSGTDIKTGLIGQGKFQECLNRLDVDYQLQDPKPQSPLLAQVISLSKRVDESASQYHEAEESWSHQAATQMDAIGNASDSLVYQGGAVSPVDELNMRAIAAKLRVDEDTQIIAELEKQCTNSIEWKQLVDANQNLSGKPLQACEELTREEKNQNNPLP
jgi:hypothetical protein